MNKAEKQELLKELRTEFDNLKSKLKFSSTFEEIDSFSYFEERVLASGYVSPRFSRQLIALMIDTFHSWIGSMHQWLMPNPQDMIFMSEANKLSKEEKEEIKNMVSKIMYFVRRNKRIALELEKNEEGLLIDELVKFNHKEYAPFLLKYHVKFEKDWRESLN